MDKQQVDPQSTTRFYYNLRLPRNLTMDVTTPNTATTSTDHEISNSREITHNNGSGGDQATSSITSALSTNGHDAAFGGSLLPPRSPRQVVYQDSVKEILDILDQAEDILNDVLLFDIDSGHQTSQ